MEFPRTEFGDYILHDRIGAGGMAEIFLATAQGIAGFERRLVIKRILPSFSGDEQFVRMFIEEAKLCIALRHPNVVEVYDLGDIEGQYFIAMEYVDGRDLLKTLAACGRKHIGFPTDIALYIVMEVLKGLDYAHTLKAPDGEPLGVIHRDVSPSNVLLSFGGDVKLADFGIAKASTREKTETGILKGKFGYMAPEQVTGSPIDHRADIFAGGIVLYELLTGHRLFAGKNDLAVLERVRDAAIDPMPRYYRPDLDRTLEGIVLRALARDPRDRFQTASELHDALYDYTFQARAMVSPATLGRFMQDLFLGDPEEIRRRQRVPLSSVSRGARAAAREESRSLSAIERERAPFTGTVQRPRELIENAAADANRSRPALRSDEETPNLEAQRAAARDAENDASPWRTASSVVYIAADELWEQNATETPESARLPSGATAAFSRVAGEGALPPGRGTAEGPSDREFISTAEPSASQSSRGSRLDGRPENTARTDIRYLRRESDLGELRRESTEEPISINTGQVLLALEMPTDEGDAPEVSASQSPPSPPPSSAPHAVNVELQRLREARQENFPTDLDFQASAARAVENTNESGTVTANGDRIPTQAIVSSQPNPAPLLGLTPTEPAELQRGVDTFEEAKPGPFAVVAELDITDEGDHPSNDPSNGAVSPEPGPSRMGSGVPLMERLERMQRALDQSAAKRAAPDNSLRASSDTDPAREEGPVEDPTGEYVAISEPAAGDDGSSWPHLGSVESDPAIFLRPEGESQILQKVMTGSRSSRSALRRGAMSARRTRLAANSVPSRRRSLRSSRPDSGRFEGRSPFSIVGPDLNLRDPSEGPQERVAEAREPTNEGSLLPDGSTEDGVLAFDPEQDATYLPPDSQPTGENSVAPRPANSISTQESTRRADADEDPFQQEGMLDDDGRTDLFESVASSDPANRAPPFGDEESTGAGKQRALSSGISALLEAEGSTGKGQSVESLSVASSFDSASSASVPVISSPGRLHDSGADDLFGALAMIDHSPLSSNFDAEEELSMDTEAHLQLEESGMLRERILVAPSSRLDAERPALIPVHDLGDGEESSATNMGSPPNSESPWEPDRDADSPHVRSRLPNDPGRRDESGPEYSVTDGQVMDVAALVRNESYLADLEQRGALSADASRATSIGKAMGRLAEGPIYPNDTRPDPQASERFQGADPILLNPSSSAMGLIDDTAAQERAFETAQPLPRPELVAQPAELVFKKPAKEINRPKPDAAKPKGRVEQSPPPPVRAEGPKRAPAKESAAPPAEPRVAPSSPPAQQSVPNGPPAIPVPLYVPSPSQAFPEKRRPKEGKRTPRIVLLLLMMALLVLVASHFIQGRERDDGPVTNTETPTPRKDPPDEGAAPTRVNDLERQPRELPMRTRTEERVETPPAEDDRSLPKIERIEENEAQREEGESKTKKKKKKRLRSRDREDVEEEEEEEEEPNASARDVGSVRVSCDEAVTVSIPGRKRVPRVTETTLELPAGSYTIKLLRNGKAITTRTVRVIDGQTVNIACDPGQ